jgi:hypothetical protein
MGKNRLTVLLTIRASRGWPDALDVYVTGGPKDARDRRLYVALPAGPSSGETAPPKTSATRSTMSRWWRRRSKL